MIQNSIALVLNAHDSGALRTAQRADRAAMEEAGMVSVGIAADHGGYALKSEIIAALKSQGYRVVDFGAPELDPGDDYPDYVIPLARAVAAGSVDRGVAVCGSGVGATIAANKVHGARACLIHDDFSAHQGVEDDDMNIICLGGRVLDYQQAWRYLRSFLQAEFIGAERHRRRLAKVAALEGR